VRERLSSASPELYLVGSVAVSLAIAAIVSRIPALAFGDFRQMAIVLVISDVVLYALMKFGLFKAPRDRPT
jgi:hypothetical protein